MAGGRAPKCPGLTLSAQGPLAPLLRLSQTIVGSAEKSQFCEVRHISTYLHLTSHPFLIKDVREYLAEFSATFAQTFITVLKIFASAGMRRY